MSEWLTCERVAEVSARSRGDRPGVGGRLLRYVLGFTADLEEEAMGLVLLRRGTVCLALVRGQPCRERDNRPLRPARLCHQDA